jgi:hypothetical protein
MKERKKERKQSTYAQEAKNTALAFAPTNIDINSANASTKISTSVVATFLSIGTTTSRKTGSSRTMTEIRTAISFARRRIRALEKRKMSSFGLEGFWRLRWRWRQD